jgi:DNA-binding NarL/FixJ family response regulator
MCGGLDSLVDDVRAARSRTLVLRGEAGAGKTALLDYVAEHATGCRILRASGVESEMELAFAGLQQFCAPLIDSVDRLPGPQREALEVVFGMRTGEPPERLMIGLAVLSLLASAAEERPVIGLVDDAQWLDRASAQALAFVARRLLAEPVGLLFALREPNEDTAWSALPSQAVVGLGEVDARLLLASVAHGPVDDRVRDRIIGECHGNPLALLELHRGMTSAELAGGLGVPDGRSVVRRIEESFQRRLEGLPSQTQMLLLLAAAEPLGDAALLWRAVGELGLDPDTVAMAKDADLIDVGSAVRFRHPLVRSMVYQAAPPEARREVHAALAQVTDPEVDPDRRAWHHALAVAGVDDVVADELERSAARAQARGGTAAAAAIFECAFALTSDTSRRAARALAAAELQLESGALDRSSELLAAAEMAPHDDLQGARLEHLRARVVFTRLRGRDAPPLLLHAAQRLQRLDPARAREVYLDAFYAAASADHPGAECRPRDVAEAARTMPPVDGATPKAVELLVDALTIRYCDGFAAAVAPTERALLALRTEDDAAAMRWMTLELVLATDLLLDEVVHERSTRHLATARTLGALGELPLAISHRVSVHTNAGEFSQAASLLEEGIAIARATGTVPATGIAEFLAAWRGQENMALPMIEGTMHDAAARGDTLTAIIAEYSASVLYSGLGRYDLALTAARRPSEYGHFAVGAPALIELIEAAARTGHVDEAQRALERLIVCTRSSPTDWALGFEARARALLSIGADADDLYRESIDRLGRTRIVVHHARSLLLYGEWLRRENRRIDARDHLRQAHEMFETIGAEAFAERARRELQATGETVRKRTDDTRDELTAQERQIAELARDGHTNPEIAAQLFLSARTVEWHLRKVFMKLGITSRRDLRESARSL